MKAATKTFKRARDASTGRFITLAKAKARPATTVVERVRRKSAIH